MQRRRTLLAGLAAASASALWALPAGAATVEVAGVRFEDRVHLAGSELLLNGTGVRAAAWFKAYAAALYLPARARSVPEVQAQRGPKRLRMVMLYGAPAAEFVKAFDKGLSRNTPEAALPALRERMQRFAAIVDRIGRVVVRDVVDLDYDPAKGTSLVLNGKPRDAPIAGADFYDALLRSFIGERPYDTEMRAGLLAARP